MSFDRIEKVIQQLESQSKSVSAEEAKQDLFHLGSRVKSKIGLRIWIDIPNNFPWRNCLTNYNNVVASTQCILKSHTGSTWRIPDWNSSFQLFNTEAKQCLEPAPSDSTTNIIQAIIKDCSEGRWKYNSLGQLSWSNGGCLTAMGAAQGNRVELHPCKDSLQQQRFEFGILDFDPAKNKTLVIPLDLKQWESRQNAYRAKELAEAKTDVLNVVNALNNIKDESKEKRRAVVFYLDKGTGFLAFLKWWILAWKLLGNLRYCWDFKKPPSKHKESPK
ncbi:uncharacterized protein LOC111714162 [Eurytemora carolleeae]|uniref:uncharacterized protein LOC111714162 n=1 Tax=Eurytemora carolleeae TaxID=1294199 RepID=UPI000C76CAB0|nr:uncharacterized protein LOC111714162 [Eurytemora carolleeae]|eukprot:XP_023344979.1 uncharacterized protein LOC111714162 [Eurytemora affinis]